jgi:hypothetical protein
LEGKIEGAVSTALLFFAVMEIDLRGILFHPASTGIQRLVLYEPVLIAFKVLWEFDEIAPSSIISRFSRGR